MIDPASFKLRFSEFACIDDAQIQVYIDDAATMLNETYWGDKYNLGLSYLAGHYLASSIKNAAGSVSATSTAGPVTSKSVDGVSVTYGFTPSDNEWKSYYLTTPYGQRYLALMKTLGVAACVV